MIVDPRKSHVPAESSSEDLDEEGLRPVNVSPIVVEAISKALQYHYRAIAEMPLPDRFLVLLAELEARERHDEE